MKIAQESTLAKSGVTQETTQVQMDGFSSQLQFKCGLKCHLEAVGDCLEICP